jgi:hypothetical protein
MRRLAFVLALVTATIGHAAPIRIMGHGTGLLHNDKNPEQLGVTHVEFADAECENLPAEFDLRDIGNVPPTRNQGSCGSCWAFAQTASLESANALQTGTILDLAEQELVSCDDDNYGCNGGLLDLSGTYQTKHGQGLETAFPYTARDSRCKAIPVAAKGVSWSLVGPRNGRATEKQVMCALYRSKTIPWITVSAGGRDFSSPPRNDDGVFTSCSQGQTNHAVGLVGWTTIEGKLYFKMRNSWGQWGNTAGRPGAERGYALMPLGCRNLGEEVAYIITDATPCKPPMVKLPQTMTIDRGFEVPLAVKPETGVDYEWYTGTQKIGDGPIVYVTPTEDTVYTVKAKNACGTAESSVKVQIQVTM